MNSSRIWTLGAVAAVVAILGGSVALGVQPALAAASVADQSTKQIDTQNGATQVELARLSRLAASESTLDQTSFDLRKAIPQTLKLNSFTRGVRTIAALDGVTVVSITPETGSAYSSPIAAPEAAAETTTAADTEDAAAAAPVAENPKSPWFGKTDARITGANFTVVPVTVTVSGTDTAVQAFAADIQNADRLFAVHGFSSSTSLGVATATLVGSIYALER